MTSLYRSDWRLGLASLLIVLACSALAWIYHLHQDRKECPSMGTNYFLTTPPCADDACQLDHLIHLGKSSVGWRFLHRAYRRDELPEAIGFAVDDKASWLKLAQSGSIIDEYGHPQDTAEFLAFVESKQEFKSHSSTEGREWERHSRLPASLIQSLRESDLVIDGYDFCDREFS